MTPSRIRVGKAWVPVPDGVFVFCCATKELLETLKSCGSSPVVVMRKNKQESYILIHESIAL